jgi:cell division transport system permease protein
MIKVKPGTVLSILSFSISLFILGFYLILAVHLSNLFTNISKKTPFVVELKDNISKSDLPHIQQSLEDNEAVDGLEFIPKEEGLKLMRKQIGSDLKFTDNPLKDIFKLKLKNDFTTENKIAILKNELKKHVWVEESYYEKEDIESLKSNLSGFNSVLLLIAFVFTIISFILIYNNLRFILHADRFQIKTMELIGASPRFIKRPYIKISIKIGIISAIISVLVISLFLIYLEANYSIFSTFLDLNIIAFVLFILVIVSTLVPPFFVNYLVNKYLKMSDSERHR